MSSFAKNVSWSLFTKLAGIIIAFLSSVMTARFLGPDGRGMYAFYTLILNTIVQFGNLGLPTAIVYTISKDKAKLNSVIWTIALLSFTLFVLCFAVLFISNRVLHLPDLQLFFLTALNVPIQLAFLLLCNVYIGINNFKVYNNLMFINTFLTFVGSLAVLLSAIEDKVMFMLLNIAIVGGVTLVWAVVSLRKCLSRPVIRLSLMKDMLSYGFIFFINTLFGFLIVRSDAFLVNWFKGYHSVGIYSVAVQFADIFLLLPSTIGMVLFPALLNGNGNVLNQTVRASRITLALMLAASLGAFLIIYPFVMVLYGKEFIGAASAFLILIPGLILLGLENVYVMYVNTTESVKKLPYVWIKGFLLNFALNLVLIPFLNFYGASVSSVISYSYICLAVLNLVKPRPFKLKEFVVTAEELKMMISTLKRKMAKRS